MPVFFNYVIISEICKAKDWNNDQSRDMAGQIVLYFQTEPLFEECSGQFFSLEKMQTRLLEITEIPWFIKK